MVSHSRLSILSLILPAILLTGCSLPNQISDRLSSAALQVTANPQAEVFINGKSIGQTPITNKSFASGTYNIVLKTDTANWADQVTLFPATDTVINRKLSPIPNSGSGEVVQSEEGSGIDVIGSPQNASVTVDNQQVGSIPLSLPMLSAGKHQLIVSAESYSTKSFNITATNGYKTIFNIDLAPMSQQLLMLTPNTSSAPETQVPSPTSAKTAIPTSSPIPAPTPQSVTSGQATIGDTGYGWLRVHSNPSSVASEVFRVNTGNTVTTEGASNGFTKIKTASGQEGWVASQYLVNQ